MRCLIPALLALAVLAGRAHGQAAELDRVDALIAAGDYAGARTAIERWWRDGDDVRRAPAAARVRALMLRARLAPDPAAAERDYLAVALGHPTSPFAPEALLSLGQGFLATRDIVRAASYLRRLVDDYPASPHRPTGLLWLARARRLHGDTATACATTRHALESASADLATLLRREEAAVCPHAAPAAADSSPAATPDSAPAEPAGRFAVQAGAFRQPGGARALADRLRRAGHQPRVVLVPGSSLLRVRVGRLADAAAATALARRLGAAGFAAVVVRDADRERTPP